MHILQEVYEHMISKNQDFEFRVRDRVRTQAEPVFNGVGYVREVTEHMAHVVCYIRKRHVVGFDPTTEAAATVWQTLSSRRGDTMATHVNKRKTKGWRKALGKSKSSSTTIGSVARQLTRYP